MGDNYLLKAVQEQKSTIESLRAKVEELESKNQELVNSLDMERQEKGQLRVDLESMEAKFESISAELNDKHLALEKINSSMESFSEQIDALLRIVFELEGEKDGEYSGASFRGDIFGINIDDNFLSQVPSELVNRYLDSLGCNVSHIFRIGDLKISSDEDMRLVAKTFCDWVRINFFKRNEVLRGVIDVYRENGEIVMQYFGDKDISEDFYEFKREYREA